MNVLQVHLLGKFNVRRSQQPLSGFETGKLQELFGYLLLYRSRPHFREVLADLLWAEAGRSRLCLRKTLYRLQNALARQPTCDKEILLVEPAWIQLNPQADLYLDVAVLEEAFSLVEGLAGADLDQYAVSILQEVLEIYQGDLMEACYADWCLYERERLRHLYLAILDKLMDYCEAYHRFEAGIMHGLRILTFDRARERTHRQLMRLHYLAGNRTAALRQYDRCAAALDKELAVQPGHKTQTLHRQIQADRPPAIPSSAARSTSSANSVSAPPDADRLARLERLQKTLPAIADQIA